MIRREIEGRRDSRTQKGPQACVIEERCEGEREMGMERLGRWTLIDCRVGGLTPLPALAVVEE